MNNDWISDKDITTELTNTIDHIKQIKTNRLILEYKQYMNKEYDGITNHPNLAMNYTQKSVDYTLVEQILEEWLDNTVKVTITQK